MLVTRQFTPKQANDTLPLVRRIVADILDKGRELRDLAQSPEPEEHRVRLQNLERALGSFAEELEGIGCLYKDWGFEKGLVDFPAEIDDQPVLLCWRSDEAAVTWFHPVAAGFAGRQLIPAELLEEHEANDLPTVS